MNLKQFIKNKYDLNGAILGTLMGDTSISKKTKNGRFQITHSPEQKEYLEFKRNLLNLHPLVKVSNINERITHLKKTDKDYLQYQIYTNRNKFATQMYDRVYKDGVKIINEDILNSIWEEDFFGNDRVVDDLVRRLRSKMKDLDINTIYGYGYRLV